MLTKRYLTSTKNVKAILAKMAEGVAPPKFGVEHLKEIGFGSSGDRAFVPLLKDLGFLSPDGAPTPRYHAYRDRSRSKAVMAEALRDAYGDVFHINERPTAADRPAVEGLFKAKHNSTDKVAQLQAMTFYALLENADLNSTVPTTPVLDEVSGATTTEVPPVAAAPSGSVVDAQLHYTIQVHLPATKDLEVYNAIFRSLRENLLT